jgi:hypothetical protein
LYKGWFPLFCGRDEKKLVRGVGTKDEGHSPVFYFFCLQEFRGDIFLGSLLSSKILLLFALPQFFV